MIEYNYNGVLYKFHVDKAVFSPKGIDRLALAI